MLSRGANLLQKRQKYILHTTLNVIQRKNARAHSACWWQLPKQSAALPTGTTQRLEGGVHLRLRCYSKDDKKAPTTTDKVPTTTKSQTTEATAKEKVKIVKEILLKVNGSDKKQTKNYEVQTSKGVLSISTTIEDSKINDIVFHKSKVAPVQKGTTAPKVIKSAAKAKTLPAVSAPPVLPEKETQVKVATATTQPTSVIAEQKSIQMKTSVEAVKSKIMPKFLKSTVSGTIKPATQPPTPTTSSPSTPVLPITTTTLTKVISLPSLAITKTPSTTDAVVVADLAAQQEQLPPKPKRPRFDNNRSSLERNFITPTRAMSDFLLKASDLDILPKIKRRSPYEQEPPITVYWRRDVEAKAFEVWGSRENLLKELLKREVERKQYQQNIFTVKRRLRDYRREIGAYAITSNDKERGLTGKSGKVVLTAIAINGINFLVKFGGWIYSGSHSMFAECIHSMADMINQIILAYGIHKSVQTADYLHPYGYANMKYVSALISGVGIFCVGCGLSIYHGITGIFHPEPMQDLFWAYFILGGTVFSEGATLIVAINELRRAAKESNMSFKEYVFSGQDPCVNVVLTEDSAAVAGVILAASCMGLSTYTGSPMYDAIGSILVGGILGGVASFIIYTNVQALVGKTIPPDRLEKINNVLESDVMIRAIHDVKGIDMGNSLVRYKAELDFDGRELTRSYLDKQDLASLLTIVQSFQNVDELETFLLDHGENIVDLMGGEIDRIEMNLRNQYPEIRHCDLEVL